MKFSSLPLLAFIATASAQSLRQGERKTLSMVKEPTITQAKMLEPEPTKSIVQDEPVKLAAPIVKEQALVKEPVKLEPAPVKQTLTVVEEPLVKEAITLAPPIVKEQTLSIVPQFPIRPIPEDNGGSCTCQSDYDCQKPVCIINPYSQVGTCGVGGPTGPTGPSPTPAPIAPTACCPSPKLVPTSCEVDVLINLLDIAVSSDHKLAAQWLRLAFHDAGTFNQDTGEGGANGCLMTDPDMRLQPENGFLDLPINTLQAIKNNWEAQTDTCVDVSAADMIQFAGLFASMRQVAPLGIDSTKRDGLKQFEWGRVDEIGCDIDWCDNLPGFSFGLPEGNIPLRCVNAGGEIQVKMIGRNGFTAQESAALIGAHTIGLTRNSFGTGHVNPWVPNGADNATPDDPVFDNAFHDFLINGIAENTVADFADNIDPFDVVFPDWFKETDIGLNHLDTDIALAFPSQDTDVHEDFHVFTDAFAGDNDLFLQEFFLAMNKMGKLGVDQSVLQTPVHCTLCDGDGTLSAARVVMLVKDLGVAEADADEQLRLKQESKEFTAVREIATMEVAKEEILSVDAALMEVQKVQEASTTLEKQQILKEQALKEEEMTKEMMMVQEKEAVLMKQRTGGRKRKN